MDGTQASIAHLQSLGSQQRVGVEGRTVSWRRYGSGTPLVLLHGGHGSWLHWFRNIEQLAVKHAVWVADMPGFGESDALAPDADLDALVQATIESIDQAVGQNVSINLIGFSFGSVVAANIALQRGKVNKLALLGPTGHGGRRREVSPMVNWRRSADKAQMLADLKTNLQILMLHGKADALALEIHRHSCLHTRFRSKESSQSPILPAVLGQLHLPMLMVWGEHDATGIAQEIGPLYQDGRPERSWHMVPNAGHWVQYEAAERTNNLLRDWFS